jgi:hypothetical protein
MPNLIGPSAIVRRSRRTAALAGGWIWQPAARAGDLWTFTLAGVGIPRFGTTPLSRRIAHALTGGWVLGFSARTGNRCADAAAAPQIKLAIIRAEGAEAIRTTADFVRATRRSVSLRLAGVAGTGRRIELLPYGAGVDALIVAAYLAQSAVDIDARATNARLAGRADMTATAAIVAIELRVDALAVADRTVITAFALAVRADFARGANVTAGATVTGVGTDADALLSAACVVGKAATGAPLALPLFFDQRCHTRKLAAPLFVVIVMTELAAGAVALQVNVMRLGFALGPVAGRSLGSRGSDCSPDHDGGKPAEQPLEQLASSAYTTEQAR